MGFFSSIVNAVFNELDKIVLPTYEAQARRKLKEKDPEAYNVIEEYEKKYPKKKLNNESSFGCWGCFGVLMLISLIVFYFYAVFSE